MEIDWKVIKYLKSKYIKVREICSKDARIENITSKNIFTESLTVNGVSMKQHIINGIMTAAIISPTPPTPNFKSFDAAYSISLAPNNNINDCNDNGVGGSLTATSISFQLNITNSTTIYRLILLGVIKYIDDNGFTFVYDASTLAFVNIGANPSYTSYLPYSYFKNYNIAVPENINGNNPIITIAPNTIYLNPNTDLVLGGAILSARQYNVEFLTILHGEIISDLFPLITHHTYTTSFSCFA